MKMHHKSARVSILTAIYTSGQEILEIKRDFAYDLIVH